MRLTTALLPLSLASAVFAAPFAPPQIPLQLTAAPGAGAEAQSAVVAPATFKPAPPGLWTRVQDAWSTAWFFATPRCVQTSPDAAPFWTTEWGKHRMLLRGDKFFDVTDMPSDSETGVVSAISVPGRAFPAKMAHGAFLRDTVFGNISIPSVQSTLETFTAFHTRHYRMSSGRESQKWLLGQVEALALAYPHARAEVREVKHPWGQNSIILRIPSQDTQRTGKSNETGGRPVVVLGAHQDSTNMIPFLSAPGADDDGSGTATIFEALRVLLASGWVPHGEYDVEWHWYSAEEGGLLGSQEVVREYVRSGRSVRAMLQQDMTAFVKPGSTEQVGLVTDFTSPELNTLIRRIVESYLTIPLGETQLGYAGSDHASWTKQGVPAAFAIEGLFADSNLHAIHTSSDTTKIDGWSWNHLEQFVRLSTAFVVELADQL